MKKENEFFGQRMTKEEMKWVMGGMLQDGCTATAVCSDGSTVSITGTGAGSNCRAVDYVNAPDGKGEACFHPENGNSQCNTCSH